jgi:hypothetical protein
MRIKLLKTSAYLGYALCAGVVLIVSGCATQPKIDVSKFTPPKKVVIENIPKIKTAAVVGFNIGTPFTDSTDYLFMPENNAFNATGAPRTGDYTPGSGIVMGAILNANAEKNQIKSAGFNDEVLKKFSEFDLRNDLMKSLRTSLEARGIAVAISDNDQIQPPRLRWPATDEKGQPLATHTLESSPPVDADLLVEVSPMAIYRAPGQLNSYRRLVSVTIAIYNGRTKQFLGKQTLYFGGTSLQINYGSYDSLIEHLDEAIPALKEALLSLVPEAVDIISARHTN